MKGLLLITLISIIFLVKESSSSGSLWNLLNQVRGAGTTQSPVSPRTYWNIKPQYLQIDQDISRTNNLNKIIQHTRTEQTRRSQIIQSLLLKLRGLNTMTQLTSYPEVLTTESIEQIEKFDNQSFNSTERQITMLPNCYSADSKKDVLNFDLGDLQNKNGSSSEIKQVDLILKYQGISSQRLTPDQLILLISEAPLNQDKSEIHHWFEYEYFMSNEEYQFNINVTEQVENWLRDTTGKRGLFLTVQNSYGETLPTLVVFGELSNPCLKVNKSITLDETEPEISPEPVISPLAYLNVTLSETTVEL